MNSTAEQYGVIPSQGEEEQQRHRAIATPGDYHGDIAARELHWFDGGRWITLDPAADRWCGWADSGTEADNSDLAAHWRPWSTALDETDAPFYRWFTGALTNACFNEVDRHVLAGEGDRTALIFEGDRWDPSRNGGRGGPVFEARISYRRLLVETVLRAEVLAGLGLARGDRVAFNLPNILDQIYYTEAAKRLGIIYTPVFGGFSAKTLSDRILRRRRPGRGHRRWRLSQCRGGPLQGSLHRPGTGQLCPPDGGAGGVARCLGGFDLGDARARIESAVRDGLAGEITIERSDLMRELGLALARENGIAAEDSAEVRTAVARTLAGVTHAVETVVVVRYTGQDVVEQPRDRWSHDLLEAATSRVLAKAGADSRGRRAAGAGRHRPLARCERQPPGAARARGLAAVHHLYLRLHRQTQGRGAYPRRLAGRHHPHACARCSMPGPTIGCTSSAIRAGSPARPT